MEKIKDQLWLRARLAEDIFKDDSFREQIIQAAMLLNRAIQTNHKVLIFGNGGSAAEAQHFAAELVCQFEKKRRAVAAIALTTDSSILTAQGNDFGFASIFSRQIEALASRGDVVIGLTTSDVKDDGHSLNIKNAFQMARARGASAIGFFSSKTKHLINLVDVAIVAPSNETALIQEVHLQVIHILCGLIEDDLH